MAIEGIDCSMYQGDLSSILKTVDFCIVKVSEANFVDPKAAAHLAQATRAGVVRGAYHFAKPSPDGVTQAKVFLANAGNAEFLVLDVEGSALHHPPVNRAFIAYVKAHDKRPILLYSSEGTWPGDLGQDGNWVANYSAPPGHLVHGLKWLFWQYQGVKIDRDRWYGTLSGLHAFAGRSVKTPNPFDPTPVKSGSSVVI